MASRLTGAVVALIAAVLLLSAVFSRGWWDGPPIVSGEVRHVQDVHVGPLGGDLCNTGGDGACHAMPLVGGFRATGDIVAVVLGLLAAAAVALAVLAVMQSERRHAVGKVMFGGAGAGAIVTLALYLQGPTLNSTQQVIMPLGHGMLFFWIGAAFAVTAGVLVRRTAQPLVLKSGPSWIPNAGGMSALDMMQGAPVAAASPGGPGLAGPLGAAGLVGGGPAPDPYAQLGVPAPHYRPPSAQLAVPPSPQNPFGSPSAPVPVAYGGSPSQPHAAPAGSPSQPPFAPPPGPRSNPFAAQSDVTAPAFAPPASMPHGFGAEVGATVPSTQLFGATPNPDRPRTLPPPPGRAKSGSMGALPTPNPDGSRPRTTMGAAIAPPGGTSPPSSIMAPPRARSTSVAPPSIMAPPRPRGSTMPPSTMAAQRPPGSTTPPPFVGGARQPGSTIPPPRKPGSTIPPVGPKPGAPGALPRIAPGPSKVPPLRGQVPFPDPELRAPTMQDAAQSHLSDTALDGHTDLNAAALDVGDHTSPSNLLDPTAAPFGAAEARVGADHEPRGSHTDVVPTVEAMDGTTDETAPAPESRSASARMSASYPSRSTAGPTATDKVPTLAGEPTHGSVPPPLSTAPDSLPPPTSLQSTASGPSPACPQCEAPMAWVEAHLRFYCKSCKMYF